MAIIDRCVVAPVKTAENDPLIENLGLLSDSAARFTYRLDRAFSLRIEMKYIRTKADRSRPAELASYTVPIQTSRVLGKKLGANGLTSYY